MPFRRRCYNDYYLLQFANSEVFSYLVSLEAIDWSLSSPPLLCPSLVCVRGVVSVRLKQ